MSKIKFFRLLYTPVDPSLVFAMPLLDVTVGSPSRYCYLASVQSFLAFEAVLPSQRRFTNWTWGIPAEGGKLGS